MGRLRTLPPRVKPAATRIAPQRPRERGRNESGQWLYGRRWRKARALFLSKHPLCLHCQAEGRVTAACEVDHIRPHRGDERLFWDESNWQGLCKPHHSAKTARSDGGFSNPHAA